jgi:hypothetical protein
MFAQFEEKGKIYTQVVSKIPVDVIVQTTQHTIRGKIHIRPDIRLKDELNIQEPFFALTDVEILNFQGEIIQKADFLAVSRSQVIWVLPLSNESDGETQE